MNFIRKCIIMVIVILGGNSMKVSKNIWDNFFNLFKAYKVPEGHEGCPKCRGMGAEDIFINCDYCEGKGHVSSWKALDYENKNTK